jgi:hypothetical protein
MRGGIDGDSFREKDKEMITEPAALRGKDLQRLLLRSQRLWIYYMKLYNFYF